MKRRRNRSLDLHFALAEAAEDKTKKSKVIKEFLTWSTREHLPARMKALRELMERKDLTAGRMALELYKENDMARDHVYAVRTMLNVCVGRMPADTPTDESVAALSSSIESLWDELGDPLGGILDGMDGVRRVCKAAKLRERDDVLETCSDAVSLCLGEHNRAFFQEMASSTLLFYTCLHHRLTVDRDTILDACAKSFSKTSTRQFCT